MAKIFEMTKEEKVEYQTWVESMPDDIQKMIRKYPPDRLYALKPSLQRVTIASYVEDGSVTVTVSGKFNLIAFDRNVFGVNPKDLIECDLPKENEALGTILTDQDDIDSFVDQVREAQKSGEGVN